MHNNYNFLRQLTLALKHKLVGFTIASCFSQEKDELIIGFTNFSVEFFIKAMLTPQFSALSYPGAYNRARANSVNLFPEIIDKPVLDIVQHQNERSFHLQLPDNLALVFKLFGNRSNIILFTGDEPTVLFQKKFDKDFELGLSQMNRNLQVNKEIFLQNPSSLQKLYPTFGDIPLKYLTNQSYDTADADIQWELLQATLSLLENPNFYITQIENRTRLSLLPLGEIRETYSDPLEALQEFVRIYLSEHHFEKSYHLIKQQLTKKITGSKTYVAQVEDKILELAYDNSLSQTADLIMANLTNIPANALEVEVYNFYTNSQIAIKLPINNSPQNYASKLYKKNKNRQIELKFLEERHQSKLSEIRELEVLLQQLSGIKTNRELKAFLKENPLINPASGEEKVAPFREFESEGFKIWVGKSAKNNDLLTQQHTFKEDLWLHAKDVAGSHVVIKYRAGKNIPEQVIEKAAQLAGWYSKRKNDSLCPVLYTTKKFVRKPKGAGPGAVVVEREKVILVKPQNPFSQYPE